MPDRVMYDDGRVILIRRKEYTHKWLPVGSVVVVYENYITIKVVKDAKNKHRSSK